MLFDFRVPPSLKDEVRKEAQIKETNENETRTVSSICTNNNIESEASNDKHRSSTLDEMLNVDLLPWDNIGEIFRPSVTKKLRSFSCIMNWLMYFTYCCCVPYAIVVNIVFRPILYIYGTYFKTRCSKYYFFNITTLKHQIITNEDKNSTIIECHNSPMMLLANVIFYHLTPLLLYFTWFYLSGDRRYGILHEWNECFTSALRGKSWFYQFPLIIIMVPINLIMSYLYRLAIPLLFMFLVLDWLFKDCRFIRKITCCFCHKSPSKFIRKSISDTKLVTFCSLWTLETICSFTSGLICHIIHIITTQYQKDFVYMQLVLGLRSTSPDYSNLGLQAFAFSLLCILIASNRLLFIYRNYANFQEVIHILKQIIPLIFSIHHLVDVTLDLHQTTKYYRFAYKITQNKDVDVSDISPVYFFVSIISLLAPVLITFILLIRKKKDLIIMRIITGKTPKDVKITKKIVFLLIEAMIAIPVYVSLSFLFCYLIIPLILIKNGVDTLRKGNDGERSVDIDPFKSIQRITDSKYNGILDIIGFENFKSKDIPLLGGIEQIGEASIQTVLTLIFILNHRGDIQELTLFLGVPFESSALSFTFSAVSLIIGLCRSFKYFYDSYKPKNTIEYKSNL